MEYPYSIIFIMHLSCLATGCSGELWTKLQEVLSTLESSASRGRKLVTPYIHDDEKTQAEHITAACDTWVQTTQVRFYHSTFSGDTPNPNLRNGSPQ